MIISTNFKIATDKIDFSRLEADFQLCKYEFGTYNFRQRNDKSLYTRLIVAYKDAFDYPFYFHSMQMPASFYVLYPKNIEVPHFNFEELGISGKPQTVNWIELITPNEKGIRDKIHILVKILLSQYLYEIENSDNRKVCQSHFYVFGKQKNDYVSTSVQFDIKHDKSIGEKFDEFHIVPKAVDFVYSDKQINFEKRHHFFNPYFEKVDELPSYFRQLRPNQIEDYVKPGGKIWKLKNPNIKKRAELEWHLEGDNIANTRGYITYDFQKKFVAFLNLYLGNVIQRKEYDVKNKYKPQAIYPSKTGYQTGLSIQQLKIIYVLDNRLRDIETGVLLNKTTCQVYVDLFNQTYGNSLNIKFEELEMVQLDNKSYIEPILVLHDVSGREFTRDVEKREDDGEIIIETELCFLGKQGFEDPKPKFYNSCKHIPKQSININWNEPLTKNGEERYNGNWKKYFEYDIFNIGEKKWINKLKVCLNELYLKTFIIKKLSVTENNFPLLSAGTYQMGGKMREYVWQFGKILLFIEDGKFQFINLENYDGKSKRLEILEKLNIDWDYVVEKFKAKNYGKFDDTMMAKSRFIFGPNMCIEIEEPDERVLFNFEKGMKRNIETTKGLSGIWFHQNENEKMYCVGSKDGLNLKTERSVKIRRFDTYLGEENFDYEVLLETMSVQFVRNEQYTVYPLFFDLISLYKEMS
jgi:hypothetical protein